MLIDMLVSFIKWSGLRCIMDELKEFTQDDNHKFRIITTSYMETTTDYKAIEELSKLKITEIKISFDTDRNRIYYSLYWLFKFIKRCMVLFVSRCMKFVLKSIYNKNKLLLLS